MNRQSLDEPNVESAAAKASVIINSTLEELPDADTFDYGGHFMKIGEYDVCEQCTRPIAEAQAAHEALEMRAIHTDDPEVREHIDIAAELFKKEAEAAIVRAELHNGRGSEKIINRINGFLHERKIHDSYDHSHHGGR